MILYFPDLDTLRLALTSGTVPEAVSRTAAVAGIDDDGHVWIQPSASLTRTVQSGLRKLGAQVVKEDGALLAEDVSCWPQLLPVRREGLPELTAQLPVLFELPDPGRLPGLVGEMLRLGNDRQSFRSIEDGEERRVLLRVIGPPYYSLLQALDRDGPAAPRAYVERAPRVWVEIGHGHALIEYVQPPPGKLLLVQAPRSWTFLDEAPFRDVYEILDFTVPQAGVRWHDVELGRRLTVPVRLTPGSSTAGAELWVIREGAIAQLDFLVGTADDRLLARLSFAVIEAAAGPTVVLRVRPSRLAPPVIELPAASFRPFQKLPNLFVPCGSRLKPPLRRDAVRKLLADDPAVITWLYPADDGQFTPESLPDQAFQSLEHWVDYVLDRDRTALEGWVGAARFDFEPFVCKDDVPTKPRPPREKTPRPEPRGSRSSQPVGAGPLTDVAFAAESAPPEELPELAAVLPQATPNELQLRLRALEKQFVDLTGPLDAPERQDLWRELALVYSALGDAPEAFVCWANAIWEVATPPAAWVAAWLSSERRGARGLTAADLDRLLAAAAPLQEDLRLLAVGLVWVAGCAKPPAEFVSRLDRIQVYLEKNDPHLSVRGCWLAWFALARLAHNDVLALARARDRLLERLYRNGLHAELDRPAFLRFSGRAGTRFQAIRDRVARLRDLARKWAPNASGSQTQAYVDLFFAFGLARLGDVSECQKIQNAVKEALDGDEVHSFLLQGYTFRIQQILEGKGHGGPLPPDLLEYLEDRFKATKGTDDEKNDSRLKRYKIDKLRQYSRILDPHEAIEAYRHWHGHSPDELTQSLAGLSDVPDRDELQARLDKLLKAHTTKSGQVPLPLARTALEVGPRLGETYCRGLLERVVPTFDHLPALLKKSADLMTRRAVLEEAAKLFERALFLSAHYDQGDQLQQFVQRFQQFVAAQKVEDLAEYVDTAINQCLRGLRKFGLRTQIEGLLKDMTAVLLQGEELEVLARRVLEAARQGKAVGHEPMILRTLLHVAGGWFYFDRNDEALAVLNAVRQILLEGRLLQIEQTKLACAYAATLAQAPVEEALQRVEELFRNLKNVSDTFTVNTHYSLSQLRFVEAVVMAVVNDEFTVGTEMRRWLDDDEFLVRRRIHRDMKAVLGDEGA